MKALHSILPLLIAGIAATSVQAGSFGGPAPFRNGSPLPTGTDGTYQAVATGTNATGIFTFAIANGVQTTAAAANSWIFFVDGEMLNGSVSANLSEGKVTGILDAGVSTNLPTNPDGSAILPITIIIPGNTGSGTFNGKIEMNSAIGAFHGKGLLTGVQEREDQLIYVLDLNAFDSITIGPDFSPVFTSVITIPGSSLPDTEFKFRGTRLSTSATAANSSTSTE